MDRGDLSFDIFYIVTLTAKESKEKKALLPLVIWLLNLYNKKNP